MLFKSGPSKLQLAKSENSACEKKLVTFFRYSEVWNKKKKVLGTFEG